MKKINKPSKDLTKKDIMYIARDCIHFSLKVKKVLEKIKVSSISQNEIESKLKKFIVPATRNVSICWETKKKKNFEILWKVIFHGFQGPPMSKVISRPIFR